MQSAATGTVWPAAGLAVVDPGPARRRSRHGRDRGRGPAYKRSHCGQCGTSVCSGDDIDTPAVVVTTLAGDAFNVKGHIFVGSTRAPEGGIARVVDDGRPRWVKWPRSPEGAWTPPPQDSELQTKILDVENGTAL
ncbi:hypothetical protein AURDEDRAFT_176137 [Auricularia subglabra TFB-10046 SS5]|uniref:Uncharacterized protein n=1 Tax=Auricularia subglabra (strain TFB-10046 / SS5) TaxID=717982 RepID=J0D753_AURST|nr:hypothetical protein AURDEDRAFT_176137 [Auricularia subglabra TFB-10046 SS5]